jgi:plasmid stabilization system protein ParE
LRVDWDPAARVDLIEILAFIAAEKPLTARRVAIKVGAAAAALNRHPQRGRRVPELAALADPPGSVTSGLDIRETIVTPWRLIYVVEARVVRIAAVVDSRRDMVAWLERHLARFGR